MIPTVQKHSLKMSEGLQSQGFSLSLDNQDHLMNILSTRLYSDTILAVIRETSTNARDAHIQAGIGETPIEITLPNEFNKNYSCRDFGEGIANEDMHRIYCEFGGSHGKRDTNSVSGFMGLGTKAPYAYSDTWSVTSWHNGTKSSYLAHRDEDGKPTLTRVGQEQSDEPSGICVSVAVREIVSFVQKAKDFFTHWSVRPAFSGAEIDFAAVDLKDAKSRLYTASGSISLDASWRHSRATGSRLIMGDITYPIDLTEIYTQAERSRPLNSAGVAATGGYLFCTHPVRLDVQMGSVEITPSREGLLYTRATKQYLRSRLARMFSEVQDKVSDSIEVTGNRAEDAANLAAALPLLEALNSTELVEEIRAAVDNRVAEILALPGVSETGIESAKGWRYNSIRHSSQGMRTFDSGGYVAGIDALGLRSYASLLYVLALTPISAPEGGQVHLVLNHNEQTSRERKKLEYFITTTNTGDSHLCIPSPTSDPEQMLVLGNAIATYYQLAEGSFTVTTMKDIRVPRTPLSAQEIANREAARAKAKAKIYRLRSSAPRLAKDMWLKADESIDLKNTEAIYVPISRFKPSGYEWLTWQELPKYAKQFGIKLYGVRTADVKRLGPGWTSLADFIDSFWKSSPDYQHQVDIRMTRDLDHEHPTNELRRLGWSVRYRSDHKQLRNELLTETLGAKHPVTMFVTEVDVSRGPLELQQPDHQTWPSINTARELIKAGVWSFDTPLTVSKTVSQLVADYPLLAMGSFTHLPFFLADPAVAYSAPVSKADFTNASILTHYIKLEDHKNGRNY